MIEGLRIEQAADPAYMFDAGREFVTTFGASIDAGAIDPVKDPLEYADAVRRLDPRNQMNGVFKQDGAAGAGEFADRFVIADNGLPQWAAEKVDLIYTAAHDLGIRNKESGSTFMYAFPEGAFDLGIVLEGANKTSELRARGMADAIRAGSLEVARMVVTSTGREVKEREGHDPSVTTGYRVGNTATSLLQRDYPDIFCPGGVKLESMHIRTLRANAKDTVTEAVHRVDGAADAPVGSVVMAGSNIYGSWMQTDLAAVQHTLGLHTIGFGAPADSAKAARTDAIWTSEVAKAQESAAHLQHLKNTKKR